MTDSVAVFPPGFRVTDDSTGEPVPGAIISFFDAGTTAPKTVYGDDELAVEIGTEITCDALGYPTSDGASTRTLVYVGTELYKVKATDSDGVQLWEHDNVKGAVVSASSLDVAVTAKFPVVTKALDYTVVADDQNTTFKINCSGGVVTITLPSAVIVGTGWKVKIQHAGNANRVIISVASGSSQTIAEGSKNWGGSFTLAFNGEDCELSSDGGNWFVSSHTVPFVKVAQGIVPVVSRVSSQPGLALQGSIYLATANGTWATGVTVLANDLVQWSGSMFVAFTPPSDCGWRVYVQNENRDYQFVDSGWVAQPLSVPATQATMEAQTAGVTVTADMQKFHPGHPKAWAIVASDGTVVASYGLSGVARSGTGIYFVGLTPTMSSANYVAVVSPTTTNISIRTTSFLTTGFNVASTSSASGSAADSGFCVAVFGDQ